ncbi:MAG: hypothetical protein RL885_08325 [Planctomycetota bacterium]
MLPSKTFRAVIVILGLLVSGSAGAQDDDAQRRAMEEQLRQLNEASREIDHVIREARESGNLLAELIALRDLEQSFEGKGPMAMQALKLRRMQGEVVLGNYAAAIELGDFGQGPLSSGGPASGEVLSGFEGAAALDAIAELAKDRKLVLINEAHHQPQHRVFTLQLLAALREAGFTHFAAETLYESDEGLMKRGYPTEATGAYIPEPVYGDLVRQAIALGFQVVPYEAAFGNGPKAREDGQAQNLIVRVFEKDPDARLIVHAGYAHIDESGTLAGVKTMAQVLKERTGIDPLTIDQTLMSEHSRPTLEHPLYRYIADEMGIEQATVFLREEEPWTAQPGRRDVTVFHPRSALESGRPTWLWMDGARKPFEVPAEAIGDAKRAILRARIQAEGEDAIPIDQVEIVKGQAFPALMLPEGEHVIEVVGSDDEVIWTKTIAIE